MSSTGEDPFGDLAYRYISHPINQLSKGERSEIEAHAVGGFQRINAALRGRGPMTARLQQSIETIRSALQRFPRDADARVTREIGAADVGLASADAASTVVGQLVFDAGFLVYEYERRPSAVNHAL
ncbi:hypothetical protein [Mycobacterium attenuatum]|uniref:hypothetical protein n=1 Tax=Mycobacterium attenuatum TaxID=2341086 RepID=UPI0010A96489|nr:hypothetical protein [Mycobacterium attenuatum]